MVTTTLRINRILYEEITKRAEKDKRSINSEIQYIIEKYIESLTWYYKK